MKWLEDRKEAHIGIVTQLCSNLIDAAENMVGPGAFPSVQFAIVTGIGRGGVDANAMQIGLETAHHLARTVLALLQVFIVFGGHRHGCGCKSQE